MFGFSSLEIRSKISSYNLWQEVLDVTSQLSFLFRARLLNNAIDLGVDANFLEGFDRFG